MAVDERGGRRAGGTGWTVRAGLYRTTRQECARCDETGVVGVERRLRVRLTTLRAGTAIRLRGKGLDASGHAFVHLR